MNKVLSILVVAVVLIVLMSCGRDNPVLPELPLEELSFQEDRIPLEGEEYIYRQSISIEDGSQEGSLFAFRLSTLTGAQPQGCFADAEGWLYHRTAGADPSLPLSQAGAHRSIWTARRELSFDFPSLQGKVSNLVTKAEVRVKSPSGAITEHTAAFRSERIIGSTISVAFEPGDNVGTGLEFVLREKIGDIFVEGLYADRFMFRLNILDENLQVVTAGEWHSSLECADLRRVRLNQNTNPALVPNQPGQFTQFESYVVTRQGIEEAGRRSVHFRVQTGNRPVALIYPRTLMGLGQYHYTLTLDNYYMAEVLESDQVHFNRWLWKVGNRLEAINSSDFRLHLRWGYSGQYGRVNSNNVVLVTNNPLDRELNCCLNENEENYGSRVVAFDLRLNGAPFPELGQFIDPRVVVHQDGSQWLRVLNLNDEARHCVLSNLPSGNYQFEVCAVDLQDIHSAPASVQIALVPFKAPSARQGILIVDDSPASNIYSPEAVVDAFYSAVVPNSWGTVDHVDLSELENDIGNCKLSATLLQNYRAVLWHSDNPSHNGELHYNIDPLEVFLGSQGNLIMSSTQQLSYNLSNISVSYNRFATERLGLIPGTYGKLSNGLTVRPYFIKAEGLQGLPDIDLNLNGFNAIVNLRGGLSAVTFFEPAAGYNYLYQFGCKPVGQDNYSPTQDEYDHYSSTYVGIKHSQNGANAVLLGFPLSYMEQADAAQALQQLLASILGERK